MSIDLYAFAPGDTSVGILHERWTVQGVGSLDDYEGQREEVRQAFAAAFGTLANSKVQIRFSDESTVD